MDLLDVMDGLEAVMGTITGLRVSNHISGQINPPHAIVAVPEVTDGDYREAMARCKATVLVPVFVFTTAASDRAGQRKLAELLSPFAAGSIPTAIAADPTLGGRVEQAQFMSVERLGLDEVAAIGHWGVECTVRVMIKE